MKKLIGITLLTFGMFSALNTSAYTMNGNARISGGTLYCTFNQFICFSDGKPTTRFVNGGVYRITGYGFYHIWSATPTSYSIIPAGSTGNN